MTLEPGVVGERRDNALERRVDLISPPSSDFPLDVVLAHLS